MLITYHYCQLITEFNCCLRLLTWEDGYCDTSERRESIESILDKNCLEGSDEMLPSNGESSTYDANLGGYPIELAVAYMSSAQYALGDG